MILASYRGRISLLFQTVLTNLFNIFGIFSDKGSYSRSFDDRSLLWPYRICYQIIGAKNIHFRAIFRVVEKLFEKLGDISIF